MRIDFARPALQKTEAPFWSVAFEGARLHSVTIAVIIASLLGLVYALLMPPLNVPDETSHFYRAYRITQGHIIPEKQALLPRALIELLKDFDTETTQQRDAYLPNLRRAFREGPADASPLVDGNGYRTTDFYDPLTYLPQAIGIGIARLLRAPAVVMTYAGRLSNFAVFLGIVALALRVLPVFRLAFVSVLFLPMTLHQAASNSADSYALAIAFLFLALVVRAAYRTPPTALARGDVAGLLVCAFFLGNAKADLVLVAAMLIIRPSLVGGRARFAALFAASVACAVLPLILWNVAAAGPIATLNKTLITIGLSNPDANLRFLEQHPLLCAEGMFHAAMQYGGQWAETAIGRFGPLTVYLPAWVIPLNVIVLLFIGLTEKPPAQLRWVDRGVAYAVCLAYIAVVMVATFVALTSLFELVVHTAYGHGEYGGMQGRYLLPMLPLAISFACANFPVVRQRARILVLAACVAVTSGAAYASIFDFYVAYSFFGPAPLAHPLSYYEGKFIMVAPAEQNQSDAGRVYYVHDGGRYWVVYPDWLTRHGFQQSPKVEIVSARTAESFHWMGAGKVINEPDWSLKNSTAATRYANQIVSLDGTLDGTVYLVGHGVKKELTDTSWLRAERFVPTKISSADLRSIPPGDPVEGFADLDGVLIRRIPGSRFDDGRVYIVEDGMKHWISPGYLKAHGLSLESARPIDDSLFGRIVEGKSYQ
jgi:uncharacterized membrane protein